MRPRDRYDSQVRERAGQILARAWNARVSATYPRFGADPLARVHFVLGVTPGDHPTPDLVALEREVAEAVRTWRDRFEAEVRAGGDGVGAGVAARLARLRRGGLLAGIPGSERRRGGAPRCRDGGASGRPGGDRRARLPGRAVQPAAVPLQALPRGGRRRSPGGRSAHPRAHGAEGLAGGRLRHPSHGGADRLGARVPAGGRAGRASRLLRRAHGVRTGLRGGFGKVTRRATASTAS